MGNTQHVTDDMADIVDDSNLLRRVCPQWLIYNENDEIERVSSAAFRNQKNSEAFSVLIESVVLDTGRNVVDVLNNYSGYGLASFTAGLARNCGQRIVPFPENNEPAHANVVGTKTKGISRRFASECRLVVLPTELR